MICEADTFFSHDFLNVEKMNLLQKRSFSRILLWMAKSSKPVRSPQREAVGVILLGLCLLSFLSVFSFHWEDLNTLNSPPASPPHNLIGPFGAWFAGSGFFLFGIGGYLIPFVFLTGGLLMTLRSYRRIWPTWSWLIAILVSLASLCEYLPELWCSRVETLNLAAPGGLIGQGLAIRTFGHWIGHAGAGVCFVTVLFLALLQLTGMHPFTPFIFLWRKSQEFWNRHQESIQSKKIELDEIRAVPPKKPKRTKKTEELFTPPSPKNRSTPKPKREPPPPRSIPDPPKNDLANVSVHISPGMDELGYQLPALTLLDELPPLSKRTSSENTNEKAKILQDTLEEFGVDGPVTHVEQGPTVTSYEVTPASGVRVERIASLERNIALALRAQSIRIQAPIPGKGAVGIEVPNTITTSVYLRELAENKDFHDPDIALPLALGKDVSGRIIIGDLSAMPHLLIAGATGAGKTVCMNSLLTGLLLSRTPEQLRLILVDPKTFEFQAYENLKHLVVPIITDPKKVTLGLRWAIKEMEKRYALFKKVKVRDIKGFNSRTIETQDNLFGDPPENERSRNEPPARLPYIVVVVDELAELMSTAQQEIEPCIVRLAQLSRAAGIHMILATQRPSVNVITGTIKANIPGRIAFRVAQGNDSRTILDTVGAEKLLGKGDMLYLPPGKGKAVRLQGAWTSDSEMHRVTDFIRTQGAPEFITEIKQKIESTKVDMPELEENDDLLEQAIEVLRSTKRASTSSLQRRLRIGYNRAANLMDLLEEKGIIGPPTETGPRDILMDLDGDIPDSPTISEAPEALSEAETSQELPEEQEEYRADA